MWIGYDPSFNDALEFLQDEDIYFENIMSSKRVGGLPMRFLRTSVPMDGDTDEDFIEAYDELYPVKRLIPSMKKVSTKYYDLKMQIKELNITESQIDDIMNRNDMIIELFNPPVFNSDYKFKIIEGDVDSVRLLSYFGGDIEIELPSKIYLNEGDTKYYYLKEIGNSAFSNCNIESIVISEYVEKIEDYAFSECRNLYDVTLPDSLKTIGKGVFLECSELKKITVPASVTSIGSGSFSEIKKLILECSIDALSPGSISTKCTVEQSGVYLKKNIGVPQCPSLSRFMESLEEGEKEYLFALCQNKDSGEILARYKKNKQRIECDINIKASNYLDDDEGVIDKDGNICEDYRDDIMSLIGGF